MIKLNTQDLNNIAGGIFWPSIIIIKKIIRVVGPNETLTVTVHK